MFEQAAESEGLVIRRPNFTKEILGRYERGLLIGIGKNDKKWWLKVVSMVIVSNQTCVATGLLCEPAVFFSPNTVYAVNSILKWLTLNISCDGVFTSILKTTNP